MWTRLWEERHTQPAEGTRVPFKDCGLYLFHEEWMRRKEGGVLLIYHPSFACSSLAQPQIDGLDCNQWLWEINYRQIEEGIPDKEDTL